MLFRSHNGKYYNHTYTVLDKDGSYISESAGGKGIRNTNRLGTINYYKNKTGKYYRLRLPINKLK